MNLRLSKHAGFAFITGILCAGLLTGCINPDFLGYVEADDVPKEHFNEILLRDLRNYFKLTPGDAKAVVFEPIKGHEGTHQYGLGDPHYFYWITLYDGNKVISDGFAYIDAYQKNSFYVEHFVKRADILKLGKNTPDFASSGLWEDVLEIAKSKN